MKKSNNIKYAIYARKSTEGDDRQMASIKDQLDIAKEIAKRENLQIVKIYQEKGSAHKVNNRPFFNDMIKQIKSGKISGIICWQTNRLARNPQESGLIQQLLLDGMLKVIRTNDKIYYPEDNVLMFGVEAGMSAQYSIDLSKNVKRGLNSKNKAGGCNSHAPQGYLNVQGEDGKKRSIAIDTKRFELIQKAFHLYLTGNYSVPEIVSIMNNDWGYLSKKRRKTGGNPMSTQTFYGMLKNPFYMGYVPDYEDKTILIPAEWQPMITQDEFWQIQKRLARTKNGNPRNLKPKIAVNAKRFELKGLMRCGVCGCSITAELKYKQLKDGSVNEHIYYHCTHKKKTVKCCQKAVNQKVLYEQIHQLLDSFTIHPKLYEWGVEIIKDIQHREIYDRAGIQEMQASTMVDLKNQLNRLLDMAMKGLIDDDEYKEKSEKIKSVMKKLEQANQDAEEKTKNWYEVVGKTLEVLKNPNEVFDSTTCSGEKRSILQSIGYNPVLLDRIIVVEPYKWLQKLTENAKKIETDLNKVITEPHKIEKTSEEVLFNKWSG